MFSEPRHRDASRILAGLPHTLFELSSDLKGLSAPKTTVIFLYPVHPIGETDPLKDISGASMGFAVQFPSSSMQGAKAWTVHKKAQANAVVVDA